MIDVPIYSQRDPKWKDKKLGFSNYTIGSHGCLLTCMSSLVSYVYNEKITPDILNSELKKLGQYSKSNSGGGFIGALMVWGNVQRAYPKLQFKWRGYNYSNKDVSINVYLKKIPTPVEVNGARIGSSKHWVLFLGDRKMMDSLNGKIESTSKYPLTGYGIYTISNR